MHPSIQRGYLLKLSDSSGYGGKELFEFNLECNLAAIWGNIVVRRYCPPQNKHNLPNPPEL
jgi:hypothetical protein